MIAKLKLWIAGAVVALSIIVGAFFSGKITSRAEIDAQAEKMRAESLRKARKIEQTSDALTIDDVRARINGRLRD